MANRCKVGLDYFPFDATFFEDDKIQLIHAEYGSKGVMVAIKLLCKIYKEGYFYKWGDDECLLFTKNAGVEFTHGFVKEVVSGLIRRRFFDKGCLDSFGILTSPGIQKRYFDATIRYKKIELISEYLLIKPPERNNVVIIKINVDINPENDDTNQHSNGNNNESKNENENEMGNGSAASSPTLQELPFGISDEQANLTGAENFDDLTPAEMFLSSPTDKCLKMYCGSIHFIPAREMIAARHHMDLGTLDEWAEVFTVQIISRGTVKKTLKDFASHFSNWMPKQNLTQSPKQALKNEQSNTAGGGPKPGRGSAESFHRAITGRNN